MHLLVLSQYFPPEIGAAQARLAAVTRELLRAGHKVEVVTSLPNYPSGKIFPGYRGSVYRRESFESMPVHRAWSYASLGSGLGRMLNYGSFAATSALVLARCRRPDCVFVESPPLSLTVPAILAARIWRVPVIVNVSDLWPDSALDLGLLREGLVARMLRRLESWAYRKADYVCAVTEGIWEALRDEKRVPESKLLFLPNGVDTVLLAPRDPDISHQKQMGLEGKKLVVYAGTHSLAHGLEVLLDTARILETERDYHFVFVGNGSAKRKLVERARSSGLPNVSFFDPIPQADVTKLYSLALCGVVSLRDVPIVKSARPAKTLAIMACGKPVLLVAKCRQSVVSDAKAGIVTDTDNPAAIADAIRCLGNNPGFASELGRNGRQYVEQHCTWDLLVGNWLRQLDRGNNAKLVQACQQTLVSCSHLRTTHHE